MSAQTALAALDPSPWLNRESQQQVKEVTPIVCLRLDVSALARLLQTLAE